MQSGACGHKTPYRSDSRRFIKDFGFIAISNIDVAPISKL